MMEEVGMSVVLEDAVVGGPADDGLEEFATVVEGAVGVVADGIAEEVGVAGAPGEDVFSVLFMHP